MKKTRAAIAALLLVSSVCGMTACGGDQSSYKTLDSATAAEVAQIAAEDPRLTGELENKEIHWMANWDINPDATGKSTPIELAIFQSRYGGKVIYHSVDWNSRYDSLANAINGDQGIDFFPASDLDAFPNGAIKNMFAPIDDYIDFEDPLFKDMKKTMDLFQWKGKHYVIANSVSGDNCCVIYNRETFEENGLEDPATLFAEGKWTWETFEKQLAQFCNAEENQFGIDGWWFESGLSATCGVPYVGIQDGKLVNNLKDPAIERLQNWMFGLGSKGYVAIGVGDYGWEIHPEYIGEGKMLYFPAGLWNLYCERNGESASWEKTFGEKAMFVPMPKDPNASEYYIPCGLDGYVMVRGGKNPEGVAKFAACKRMTITNERANAIGTEQMIKDYGWTQEMVDMKKKCDELAMANPHYDFYTGTSKDVTDLLDAGENSVRVAAKGSTPWSESLSVIYAAIDSFLNDYNNS